MAVRRFIMVQLPEPLDPESGPKVGAASASFSPNIAELTKERLRRAEDHGGNFGDIGFRVFKLDSATSAWDPEAAAVDLENAIYASTDISPTGKSRTCYELLLKSAWT